MPKPVQNSPTESNESARNRYLDSDKKFNLKDHLDKLKKEDASGLKGIEIRNTPKQLGKDDFLKLLITQLSKQDPTNPVKDQDFIAQMANFSSLEQMKNVAHSLQKLEMKQSYNLIGKLVSGPDFLNGENVTGVVGAVFFDGDGKAFVRVSGRTIEVDKIQLISSPEVVNSENIQEELKKENGSAKDPSSFPKKDRNIQSEDSNLNQEYPGSVKSRRNAYK